ncbi:MAG: Ig-like domain-containing protein, partial [Fuerstiella sp.]
DVTVNAVNDAPTLNALFNVSIAEDASEQTVNLSGIAAGGGESQPLRVTATSSSTGLIPNPTVTYTTANATGSIAFTPVADQSGTATITVTVEDGGLDGNLSTAGDNATFSRTFDVTVNAVNDVPTLDAIGDVTINEDASEQTVNLTGITAGGGESQVLRVTSTSSNTSLIPNPAVTYTSANATGNLKFTPVTDQIGTATITVTVEDGGPDGNLSTAGDNATFSRTFDVTVNAVIPENPGDVDGDQDFDANDSFLIHLVKLSGTDTQINQSKGSSPLSAVEIRAALTQLNTLGDVDGDQDFDANDSFLIHLVKLSGTDAQIDQSKGNSPLTAAQIRANINALGGGATTSSVLAQGPQVLQPVLSTSVASDSAAVGDTARKVPSRGTLSLPDHKLFTDEDFDKVPSPVQPVIQVLPNSGYERLWEDFRHWIDSI